MADSIKEVDVVTKKVLAADAAEKIGEDPTQAAKAVVVEPVTTTTGTTTTVVTTPEPVVEPEVTPEPVVIEPVVTPPLISKEEAQNRINRMYARLQTERGRRTATEINLAELKNRIKIDPDTGEEIIEPKTLTQSEVEAIWDRKENERKFKESETKVLMRHPEALNDDGSFNMESPFTKMYIDIGRQNQSLCFMVNGPELAEAMVEKQLGVTTTKPKATTIVNKTNGAQTARSTIAVPATKITQLPDFKKKIAARMGMTEVEYISYEEKIKKGDNKVATR